MPPLRVMTFNIRGFWHDDGINNWQHREALNVATIRRCAPDLIGFQEVQGGNLKACRRLLPEHWCLAWPEYDNGPPHAWNAIFWDPWRLAPVDSGGFWLSETPERFSGSWSTDNVRSATWMKFRDLASDVTFVHLNTHLDHRSELARTEGSKLILRRLRDLQSDGAAAVITGDFNAPPGSPTYRLYVNDGFGDVYAAAGGNDGDLLESYTNHGWRGYPFDRPDDRPLRIDWILARDGGLASVLVRSCEIVRDAAPPLYPSDHYPLLAELELSQS